MRRFRVAGLALLALAVPTFAFGGEEAPSGPAKLSVSASLGGCGLANAAIVCQIDAGWNGLEGADYYSVSVTRPDGSVLDLGQSGGTSRNLFVPYVGSGSYSVQVVAWGTPPGEDKPEVLAREKALSTGDDVVRDVRSKPDRSTPAGEGRSIAEEAAGSPASDEDPASTPPVIEPDDCPEPGEEEAEAEERDADEDAEVPAIRSEECPPPPPKLSPVPPETF